MQFKSIEIQGIGPYRDKELLTFNLINPAQNVTLIHATNIVGKTSLLRAIRWCLYGEVIPDDSGNVPDIQNHTAKQLGEESLVRIDFLHNKEEYRLVRKIKGSLTTETLGIIDKRGSIRFVENVTSAINEFAPKALAEFFFLKGENNPFGRMQPNNPISESVKRILGFNIYEDLLRDLDYLIPRILGNNSASVDNDLQIFRSSIQTLNELNARKEDEIEKLLESQSILERRREVLIEIISQNKLLLDRRKSLARIVGDMDDTLAASQKIQMDRRNWIKKGLHILPSHRLSETTLPIVQRELLKGRIPAKFQKVFIEDLLIANECICGRSLDEHSPERAKVVSQLEIGGDARVYEAIVQIKATVAGLKDLKQQYVTDFISLEKDRIANEKKYDELVNEKEELSALIQKGDEDALKSADNELRQVQKEIERQNLTRQTLEQEIRINNENISNAQKQLERNIEKNKELATLFEFQKFIKQIREELTEKFNVLRKDAITIIQREMQHFVERSIPDKLIVKLNDDFTYEYDSKYVATGAVARVLGLSFTAAILSFNRGNKNGLMIPLVMDSPFGELDHEIREKIAKYLPSLAPQLIVMLSEAQSDSFSQSVRNNINNEYVIIKHVTGKSPNVGMMEFNGKKVQTILSNQQTNKSFIKEWSTTRGA